MLVSPLPSSHRRGECGCAGDLRLSDPYVLVQSVLDPGRDVVGGARVEVRRVDHDGLELELDLVGVTARVRGVLRVQVLVQDRSLLDLNWRNIYCNKCFWEISCFARTTEG